MLAVVSPTPDDLRLSDVLRSFARTMITDFSIGSILDELARQAVALLPVETAGVALLRPDGRTYHVSASSRLARRFEDLQVELGEGPCLTAFRTRARVIVDLRDPTPFPTFAARARREGLTAAISLPLRQGDRVLGALDLYGLRLTAFAPADLDAAQTLADVAAAYVINAEARDALRAASERFREIALHDPLTQLPNRLLFTERLDHALQRAQRSANLVAVLFADIDRFKDVNDLYGHRAGDDLLVDVADRLHHATRPGDTLARLAGDEFAVLCEDLADRATGLDIAGRLTTTLDAPFEIAGRRLHVTASIGVAFADAVSGVPVRLQAEEVLGDADAAMYRAKRAGGAHHQVIDLRERSAIDLTTRLHRDLEGAVGRGELRLLYQPIVAAADGHLHGVESLVRWHHPTDGEIPPSTLIPIAEDGGHIGEIGSWVLRRALADSRRWEDGGHGLQVAINVSPAELMRRGYVDSIAAEIPRSGDQRVTLEITEDVLMLDPDRTLIVLHDLHDLGVHLSLDDFGTGYSSLSHLHRFPVDAVKLDRSFVAELGRDRDAGTIVAAIINLAHDLNLDVVGEGVETSAQYEQLLVHGCDLVQGYFIARPGSAAAIDAWRRNLQS